MKGIGLHNSIAREKLRSILGAICAILAAIFVFFLSFAGGTGVHVARAATMTNFDKSDIEDDLRELGEDKLDLMLYPKNKNGCHALMDNVGFLEYCYTTSAILSQYYSLYFYVYNPTEREVNTNSRSNFVNMATKYNALGEPSDYNNVEIQLLNSSVNNRFLKFGLIDKNSVYSTARDYASKHDGERRYDIASIQLWFKGDPNATDSNTNKNDIAYTYRCTGYAKGCGASGEEATLKIEREQLEVIALNVHHTYYRTGPDTGDYGVFSQKTLTSVYFGVPRHYVVDYGQLQFLKAQWYEYKTNWIFVTDNEKIYNTMAPYRGYVLPDTTPQNWTDKQYYSDEVPFSAYYYKGPNDSGIQGIGYNNRKSIPAMQRFDWLIKVDDISNEVNPNELAAYANNYQGLPGDSRIEYGGKSLNANLFLDTVDEGHTRGYNLHVFDARKPDQRINLNLKNTTSDWDKFLNLFRPNNPTESFITQNNISPIEQVTDEAIGKANATVSQELLVAESRVDELKEYCNEAKKNNEIVYMLRIGVSNYNSIPIEFHKNPDDIFGLPDGDMYLANDTAYLDFEIIYLGFVKNGVETIVPVAMSPIDIYPTLTAPPSMVETNWWKVFWWLIGITGACLVFGIAAVIIEAKAKR